MKKFLLLMLFSFNVMANEAYILYDVNSNHIVTEKNKDETHSIASLSKLMTAMVILDNDPDMPKHGRMQLEMLLMKSSNQMAEALAKTYQGGRTAFITDMNLKAKSLGLKETAFADPSGLSVFNRSTAAEYVRIVLEAEKYPAIREISSTYEKRISKRKYIRNTNTLLKDYDEIAISKTGFTNHAGRCLALLLDNDPKKYVLVILGETSTQSRTSLAKELINMTK